MMRWFDKKNILGFMFLLFFYSEFIFLAVEGLIARRHFTTLFILYSVILAFLAFMILLSRVILNGCKIGIRKIVLMGFIFCMVMSFWCTQYRYGEVNALWLKAFLIMGVRVLPIIAMVCASQREDYYKLIRFVPLLIFLFTTSTIVCILKAGGFLLRTDLYNSEINTYQSLGYYMSYSYSLSISYLSCERKKARSALAIGMIALIPLQWFCILTLGAKGPIIIAVVATGIILITSSKGIKKILLLGAGLMVLAPCYIPFIYQFAGIQRLLNIKIDLSTMNRLVLWKGAFEAGMNKIFSGNGIGSEYYLIGFHSHNILFDIFMEYGPFGFFVFIVFLATMCVRMIRFLKKDRRYIVLTVIFFNSLFELMFSGYYLSSATFCGTIAYILVYKISSIDIEKNCGRYCLGSS